MIPAIIVIALLALAGFLFWVANHYENLPTGFFAVGALFAAVQFANGVLS